MSDSVSLTGMESLDAEDFPWVGDASDRFAEVFEVAQRGNQAFREGRFEEAITCYSKAQLLKPGDPIILGNRSAAFCRISKHLRDRSASESEYDPLNGLDPTTHAELALKDAEKVMNTRSNSPRSYLLKATALILLEQYEDAREALLSGLQLDPFSHLLRTYLQDLEKISTGNLKKIIQRTYDFECTLCLKLLYEPVTTPCGHSFCRSCLLQAMDHGNKCPMCRTILFISPRTYPISVTLNNIIQKNFPEEYAERKSEQESFTLLSVDMIPLFVMDLVLPCQKMSLNIFEPRYRLMISVFWRILKLMIMGQKLFQFHALDCPTFISVRRVMEGNRRMGMVGMDSATGSVSDFACEVEILECEPLPDGRFYLEVEGRRRFHILRSWDQDGYRVAEVQWIQDLHPPEGSQERDDLQQMVSGAAELAQAWIRRAREAARIGRRRHLELQPEGMPGPHDPERFSYWLVNLLKLRPSERMDLLRLRDTRERISRGLVLMRAEEQSCRVQ